jgi:SulP family sulfate permease
LSNKLSRLLPALTWIGEYNRDLFAGDALAAVIVAVILIPQALAYALLAGLPAQMGLYASILPLVAYALFGTSRTLSVGPVAVTSLMTAAAVGSVTAAGSLDYATAAIAMAVICGLILLAMGVLRFGFLVNFLSQPVIAGFITASGILIGLSQLRYVLGTDAHGDTLPGLLASLIRGLPEWHGLTLCTGTAGMAFLLWTRSGLKPLLRRVGLAEYTADIFAKAGPVLLILATTTASYQGDFSARGVELVGVVPRGLPTLELPSFDMQLWSELLIPAMLVSVIAFISSVSAAKTLAAKRRQRIDSNRELIALGAANLASGMSGGFPVAGGLSRSTVNFDAGAQTPAAGVLAALAISIAALLLTPALFYLPQATLAATIIVTVSGLIDFAMIRRAWRYSRPDFSAVSITIAATLLLGVELGVLAGIFASTGLHLYKTSRPHIAVVGEIAGTEHFRNVERHTVITYPNIVSLRVDESLYFANASYLEDYIYRLVAEENELQHVILQCTAVNEIDLSALDALAAINHRLKELGLSFNLSEVKGPVMDALRKSDFLQQLGGRVYLTQHQAVADRKPDVIEPYII